MPELAFVSFDPSVKVQSATVRKTVRSQAAKSAVPQKKRLPAGKQRARLEAKSVDGSSAQFFSPTSVPVHQRPLRLNGARRNRQVLEAELLNPSYSTCASANDANAYASGVEDDRILAKARSDKSLKLMSEPTHPMLAVHPVLARPYAPLINDYYTATMIGNLPDLDLDHPGILRDLWYPYVLVNPSILPIILLLAGAGYASTRMTDPAHAEIMRMGLIELKVQSLNGLRAMISDPANHTRDKVIAAIVKLASYESTFGSLDAYEWHMEALKKMVAARGGLKALGLDGLLARMILWVDYHASYLLHTRLHFPEEANGLPKPIAFGVQCFTGETGEGF